MMLGNFFKFIPLLCTDSCLESLTPTLSIEYSIASSCSGVRIQTYHYFLGRILPLRKLISCTSNSDCFAPPADVRTTRMIGVKESVLLEGLENVAVRLVGSPKDIFNLRGLQGFCVGFVTKCSGSPNRLVVGRICAFRWHFKERKENRWHWE